MFIPSHFKGAGDAMAFISRHSFGQLISAIDGKIACTHLPFLAAEGGLLTGHLARANPQAQLPEGAQITCVFSGAHGYISPSWYTEPGVPTWNYEAVHLQGRLRWVDDEAQATEILVALSRHYEASLPTPWEPVFNERLVKAIRAFHVEVVDVAFKQKLSQNRTLDDRLRVIETLRNRGDIELAEAMAALLAK
ncbi:FMN-binding negative transcriptional regulator [Simiduia sp. 21SJ11W-1]|uniref:FMN-binding negative transcriptional regulator n=1 Tax=Simiduia sp. 21SJ11W-1 TaxID=2909669 RepID=UPI0020A0DE0A|nr:FMN-binding negative transcriptional regulator [Simiduia sp. 21SJ11W-1]UTA47196.1 FMN-binding negative transcriptional regulator [Simiduia sp. 21SJ11W-1]